MFTGKNLVKDSTKGTEPFPKSDVLFLSIYTQVYYAIFYSYLNTGSNDWRFTRKRIP